MDIYQNYTPLYPEDSNFQFIGTIKSSYQQSIIAFRVSNLHTKHVIIIKTVIIKVQVIQNDVHVCEHCAISCSVFVAFRHFVFPC